MVQAQHERRDGMDLRVARANGLWPTSPSRDCRRYQGRGY